MPSTSPKPAAGAWMTLSRGRTWYQLAGPENGAPVVLIHGFSVPSCVWDGTFEHLVKAGFRVLRYDLYGRGRSARPLNCDYGLACYVTQLAELADAIPLRQPLGMVGLSMGGPVAAAFASQYPQRVRAVALIDPVVEGVPTEWKQRLLAVPQLGEWLLRWRGRDVLSEGMAADFHRTERMPSSLPARYRAHMDVGFFRALHRSLRQGMLGDHRPVFRALGQQLVPVLAVWGEEDRTVPPSQAETLKALVPHATVKRIPQAGHLPHIEQPDAVHPLLAGFLAP